MEKELPEQRLPVQEFDDYSPAEWVELLKPFEEGRSRAACNSMLAVYEVAALRAENERSLEWAEVAVRALDVDVRDALNESERENALYRVMRFRTRSIIALGARAGHPVLDLETVLQWAGSALVFPVAVVESRARTARREMRAAHSMASATVDELVRLRRLRYRIDVLHLLDQNGLLAADSPLREWLPVRSVLP